MLPGMPELTHHREAFQDALHTWYRSTQRPLPWRTQPSLYRTVVSNSWRSRPQINTMLPYFQRWMRRFPDFETLADAPAEEVLKHWEGLGYYSRARNLHQLAKEYVCIAHTNPPPARPGKPSPASDPYTSAAISSIATTIRQPSSTAMSSASSHA